MSKRAIIRALEAIPRGRVLECASRLQEDPLKLTYGYEEMRKGSELEGRTRPMVLMTSSSKHTLDMINIIIVVTISATHGRLRGRRFLERHI